MDHPGVEMVGKREAVLLGGLAPAYFRRGTRLRFYRDGLPVAARVLGYSPKTYRFRLASSPEVDRLRRHDMGTFELEDFAVRNGRVHARQLDDLAGSSVSLAAMSRACADRRMNLHALLTRAEEEGFVGTLGAIEDEAIPGNAIIINVEASKAIPGVEIGGGPGIRGGDRRQAKALLRRILAEGIEFRCFAFCRLEIYKDPEFLTLLKQAGFDPLFIGFESFNDRTLQSFDKHQTAARIIQAIQTIKDHGLRISGSFIIGSDDDTVDGIRANIEAALRHGIDNINIFPLAALPGRGPQPIPRKRMILLDYDFGSGNHVTLFPKQMKPSTLQQEYIRAYRQFNNAGTALKAIRQGDLQAGIERFAAYLAHRAIIADIEKRYLPLLYKVEEGLYDKHERLIEDQLPPHGVVAEGYLLPPEEATLFDPQLQQGLSVANFDPGFTSPPGGDIVSVATLPDIVRAHTLDMALRKCYGNQI